MKRPYLISLGVIVIILAGGLILASLTTNKKYKFKRSAESLHAELIDARYLMDPQTAMKLISGADENYVFVDLRNPREYDNFHIEGAVNVPMQRVLDDDYVSSLENDRIKVLYSEQSVDAEQVRLLLTQYGYENLMVLQGGASYWKEYMLSKDVFKTGGEYNDEKLKFDPEKLKKSS